eukprot:4812034-Amphidinium_carterae.1
MGTWRIADWLRPDNQGNNSLWLDRSVATWKTTPTQWCMNAFTAVTLLNTHSFSVGFKQRCDNNQDKKHPGNGKPRSHFGSSRLARA